MAAATVSDTKVLAEHRGKIEASNRNLLDEITTSHGDCIDRLFGDSFTIPTTSIDDANDIYRLYKFPGGAYLTDLRVTASDADTHATPTLVFDVVVTDSADVVKDTLINDTTIGQAGGTARMADTGLGQFVGDRFLAVKIATGSATGAAMTLGVIVKYAIGIHTYTGKGGTPVLTDIAV